MKSKAKHARAVAKPTKAGLPTHYQALVTAIAQAHHIAQRQAVQAVNLALTLRNWLVGYHIVEYEQHGSDRAQYGERLLEQLSQDLRKQLGRGFGRRNLFLFRDFYLRYPIVQSLIAQFGLSPLRQPSVSSSPLDWQDDAYFARLFRALPWTHFIELIRMDDRLKRAFYEVEVLRNRWSVRELKRQIGTLLYERVGLSRDREGVLALAEEMEEGENPPIGLLLCSAKSEQHVEYALGGLSNRLFVSRYLLHLPTKEELEVFLQRMRKTLEG